MGDKDDTNAIELQRAPIIIMASKKSATPPKDEPSNIKIFSPQVISAIIVSSTITHAGVTIAFPNLLRNEFDEDSVAAYASSAALATPLGTFITGLFNDRIGRKKTTVLFQLLSIFTWLVATLLENPVFFYTSSIFGGLTRGALTATCPPYVAEMSQGEYRQLFLSLSTLYFIIGNFLVTIINELLKWQEAALCFIVFFTLLLALVIFFVPESPHWLAIIKLDMRQAKEVLRNLYPNEKAFNKEWKLIMKKQETISSAPTFFQKLAMIRKARVYKPCIILLILILFQQLCCIYPMLSFTFYIIPKVSNKLGKKYESKIFLIVGVLRLILGILTTLCLTKINQKQLLLISSAGMLATALPICSLKFIWTEPSEQIYTIDWILLILLVLYICLSSIGVLGVPWTIISELLPTEVRGLLGPFLVTVGYVTMSGALRIFPFVLETVSIASLFLFLTVLSLLGLVFIHVYIPETKGKSLVEIEKFFTKKEKRTDNSINA